MRAAQASPLSRAWLRRQACGCGGGRAWEGQYRTRGEPSFYDVLAGLPGFAKRSERGGKGHRHEVGRHPVRHRVKGLAEVAPDVGDLVDLAQLQAVANRFRDLGWGDVFIAGPVSDRVDQRDGLPDPLGGPACHQSRYSAAAFRGPTTTRRSASSPMLPLVTSGSPSSARWIARRSKACIPSTVIASPVILTSRAARIAISRTVCSRRCL